MSLDKEFSGTKVSSWKDDNALWLPLNESCLNSITRHQLSSIPRTWTLYLWQPRFAVSICGPWRWPSVLILLQVRQFQFCNLEQYQQHHHVESTPAAVALESTFKDQAEAVQVCALTLCRHCVYFAHVLSLNQMHSSDERSLSLSILAVTSQFGCRFWLSVLSLAVTSGCRSQQSQAPYLKGHHLWRRIAKRNYNTHLQL